MMWICGERWWHFLLTKSFELSCIRQRCVNIQVHHNTCHPHCTKIHVYGSFSNCQYWANWQTYVSTNLFHLLTRGRKGSVCLARMQWPDQGVKWPECGGSWGLDGCKKARWPAAGGCLAALGRGLGTWRGDNDPDVEIRAKAAPPCFGNLPVFNVGKRTGGGQVLPNGNIAAPPAPVEEFLNQDWGNLTKCDKFFLHGLLEMLAAVIVSVFWTVSPSQCFYNIPLQK